MTRFVCDIVSSDTFDLGAVILKALFEKSMFALKVDVEVVESGGVSQLTTRVGAFCGVGEMEFLCI